MRKSRLKQLLNDDGHVNFADQARDFQNEREQSLISKSGARQVDSDKTILQTILEVDNDNAVDDDDDDGDDDNLNDKAKQVVAEHFTAPDTEQDKSDSEADNDDPDNIKYRGAWSDDEDEDDLAISRLQKQLEKKEKLKESDFYADKQTTIRPRTNAELEDAKLEEEEMRELQSERSRRLTDADFIDADLMPATSSSQIKPLITSDAHVADDTLGKEEKLKIIERDAPELVSLVQDLQAKLSLIRDQIHPILNKVKSNRVATKDGISYLEVKFHLLLSYCINIVYYLYLKASGKQIKDHPVIDKLLESRLLMEHIKPIDDRMKNQLDKLVALAAELDEKQLDMQRDTSNSSQSNSHHGPNPDQLMSVGGNDMAVDQVDNDDLDDNIYKVPKVTPVSFDDDDVASKKKQQKKQQKLMDKVAKSKLLRTLKNIYDDGPEEEYNIGSEPNDTKGTNFSKELEDFEMSTFQRKQLTKKEKQMLKQKTKITDELQELESFTDVLGVDKYLKSRAAANSGNDEQRVNLLSYVGDAQEAKQIATREYNLDKDSFHDPSEQDSKPDSQTTTSKRQEKKRKRQEREAALADDGTNDAAVEPVPKKFKKQQREEQEQSLNAEDGRDEQGKRRASKKILKNRGLTAPSKDNNSRVKLKRKFHQKNAPYRAMQEKSASRNKYQGEEKITKNVRSSKLK